MGQNDNSDPYAIQEPRQKPYTNPYDILQGYSPNDYVYKSTQQAPTNDPHGKTWTLEEQKKKQLNDLTIERSNLEASFVGMPTTEVVVKLGAFDDEIAQLSQELGVTDSASVPTMTEPIPEHSLPAPKVPTMMEPIPENGQPEEPPINSDPYAIQENRQAPYTNPYDIPSDYNPNDYVYADEQTPVYTNPYDIPWTDEQEKSKRLSDATIERDNLEKSFVGMPTTEDIVKLGEYDDEIARLTQELGVGQKEYTPGIDGGWQEETKPAPYTAGAEGGDIGADALQGVHFGGSGIDRGVPDTGGAGGGGGGGGSWGDEGTGGSTFISQKDYDAQLKQIDEEQKLIDQAMIEIETFGIGNPKYNYVSYQPEMGSYSDLLNKKTENDKRIEDLGNQRTESVKTDPNFNTTGIISNQNTLGSTPYGSQGTASGNCCGAAAAHNALVLLGDNSNFADVYTYFNDDSKLNLGGLAGGKLGTDPFAVADYLEREGHEVVFKDFKTEEFENPGTYILVYGYQNVKGQISAHFKTAESDGSTVKTYNSDKTYFIGGTNNSGDNQAANIENLKSDSDMLEVEKSWLLNLLANPINQALMELKDDDTYFSYIISVK